MSLYDVAKAIEASHLGTSMRESMYWFAALNLVHLLGLLIAAGTIVFWDLRLLGIGLRRAPVSQVGKSLLPWTRGGFAVMFLSGSLLFTIEAGRLYSNIFFRIKVAARFFQDFINGGQFSEQFLHTEYHSIGLNEFQQDISSRAAVSFFALDFRRRICQFYLVREIVL